MTQNAEQLTFEKQQDVNSLTVTPIDASTRRTLLRGTKAAINDQ